MEEAFACQRHRARKRCRTCATLQELRRQATTAEAKAEVAAEFALHHDENKADRNAAVRANHIAEEDVKKLNLEDGHGLFGKMSLDGMDEAKLICPEKT